MTALLALYGACLSTVAIGWNIWTYARSGPRLKVSVQMGMVIAQQGVTLDKLQRYTLVEVTNVGKGNTTIQGYGCMTYPNKLARIRRKPSGGGVVKNVPEFSPVPHKLEPGEIWRQLILEDDEFLSWVRDGLVYLFVSHSMGLNAVRIRPKVTPNDQTTAEAGESQDLTDEPKAQGTSIRSGETSDNSKTPPSWGTYIALYAAILSTALGAWNVWTYFSNEPRLKVALSTDMPLISDGNLSKDTYFLMEATNVGGKPTTSQSAGITFFKTKQDAESLSYTDSWSCIFTKSVPGLSKPVEIVAPGESWRRGIPATEVRAKCSEEFPGGQRIYCRAFVDHSMGERRFSTVMEFDLSNDSPKSTP